MEKIKITPKEFIQLLNETTLSVEQKNMIIELIPTLSITQVNQIIDLLFTDAKNFQQILAKMESQQQEAILNFEIEVERIKNNS